MYLKIVYTSALKYLKRASLKAKASTIGARGPLGLEITECANAYQQIQGDIIHKTRYDTKR